MIISLYMWLSVLKQVNKKVSYKEAWNFEKQEGSKINYDFNKLDLSGFDKPYKTFDTRFGSLDLYKHGKGEKVVIFVHGILTNNRTALKILDYFLNRNYIVISYDNYGWGRSRDNFNSTTTLGFKESDLLDDVVKEVKKDLQPKELIVYGESMGGGTTYNYINKYRNQEVDKFVIDAGYNSFFGDVMKLGYRRLWYFAYLGAPMLSLFFLMSKWPIKRFVKKDKFKTLDNVMHLQSKEDKSVDYLHTSKFFPLLKNHHVYETKTQHCLGVYQAREEHYKVLDNWLNVNK